MTVLFKFFSFLPLWILHPIGWLLGWLVFALSGTYRKRLVANAATAGYSLGQIHAAVGHAGRMVAEMPRLWLGAPVPHAFENQACVDKAYEAGKGIVFLTPHLGCFEITAQAVAQHYGPRYGPLTCLYRPARQAWLAQVMETARNRPGLAMAQTTLAGVRQMMRSLRQGQAVGLLPDQVPPQGLGQWAPFFGRDAYTMTLAARLVQQTGATPLLAWGERLPFGKGYCIHFREFERPMSPVMDEAVVQINQAMEQLIRECPQQYLWGYGRYKQPRQEL